MKQIQIQDIDIKKIRVLGVYELRNLARSLGIPRPTTLLRADLIEGIMERIGKGELPAKTSIPRGRPPREFTLDFSKITETDVSYFGSCINESDDDDSQAVCCADAGADVRFVSGYIHTGNGNSQLIGIDLVGYLIPARMITSHHLTMGDFVEAKAIFDTKIRQFILTEILLVGGAEPSTSDNKPVVRHFDMMEGTRPHKSTEVGKISFKLGQRVLVNCKKDFDRVEHIVSFAKNKEIHPIALLIEETDDTAKYVRESGIGDVFLSKVNFNLKKQVMACLLALFKAKHLAEEGKDVILFVDSLRKLFRIYNNSAFVDKRLILNNVNLVPLADLKSYFQSARQLDSGGSLTIIAYMNAPGNAMEEYVLNEFSDAANLVVEL